MIEVAEQLLTTTWMHKLWNKWNEEKVWRNRLWRQDYFFM